MDSASQNAENHLCNHRFTIIIVSLISKQTHRFFTFPDHGSLVLLPILFDYLW